jgi:GNAT superfamily N-acetyltransferase
VHTVVDHQLALRLERFACADVRGFAETAAVLYPGSGAEFLEVAGGVAGYVGPGSPVNGAVGLGLEGEVGVDAIAEIEAFYLERAERPIISVCPFADPSLTLVLEERGWTAGTLENVLVREIGRHDLFDPVAVGVEVRTADGAEDLDAWAFMAASGFSAPDEPTAAELQLATIASRREGARFLFGIVDGAFAGTGQLEVADGLGWLSGDTTLPRFRRRGVQSSLQRVRLGMARDAGCSLAVTESVPGSASQRNMERLGFRVAYTRVDAICPSSPASSRNQKGTSP